MDAVYWNDPGYMELREKLRRNNQILFSKDSLFLQDLRQLLEGQHRRVLILWALDLAEEIVQSLEIRYPGECRPRDALEAARAWAAGEIKMPVAQRAILNCHALAKELSASADAARCHAVGQACSVVHTAGHAMGFPMYDLTAIILEQGPDAGWAAVTARKEAYLKKLRFWQEQEPSYAGNWAGFLR